MESESKKLFGDLETKLKAKIEKLGLDKLNIDSPIQVKVVATNVPVGEDDIESMGKDYYEGILHNIMIGNDKGYKDIQNQFAADKNYKFRQLISFVTIVWGGEIMLSVHIDIKEYFHLFIFEFSQF